MPSVARPKRQRQRTFIAEWREFRGLNQQRAAERMGISRENYGRIENGKVPYNQDTLEMAAAAFSCSVSDLLERDPKSERLSDKLRHVLKNASFEDQRRILAIAETLLKNNG
jgi:transcriptional regulator with XRE-family HTH domain